ncbi:hypothetical protein Pla163_00090 [Planctomycetes bacterium Pla163]|uniref:Nickel uptake substrate-specific transmembrane region n=1 Tax=Rohdeia mirabilis TaxID=2528008 RepID=A0A518CUL5_9BACT|nr:hypothetical protein Pla163_00090 [Planctomycetes bacterium Pla163]
MFNPSPLVRLALLAAATLALTSGIVAGTATVDPAQDAIPDGMARFEVIDAEGQPVSGAEIFMLEEERGRDWNLEERGIADQDWFTKVALLGRSVRTNMNGICEVPLWEDGMLVVAHKNGRYFARNFRSSGGPHECPLRTPTDVRVRLTDASGKPLTGGEVALRADDGIDQYDLTIAPMSTVDEVANLFAASEWVGELEAGSRLTLAQVGVFREVPTMEVDIEQPNPAVLTLTGRPTASLDLTIVDATAGGALRGELDVRVRAVRRDTDSSIEPPPLRRVTDTGQVTIPHVGLGLELIVELRRPNSETVTRIEMTGPMKAGEVLSKRIEYKERDVLLMARVLDAQGNPLSHDYIDVYFKTGNFLMKGEGAKTVRSRDDGRIQYPLVCRGRDAVQWAEVDFVREVLDLNLRLEHHWEVRVVTEAQIIDLGDITLK